MKLQIIDRGKREGVEGEGQRLFLNGKKTCYLEHEVEIKAKHWIATEIEKLIGLDKNVRIVVEEWQP